MTNDWPRGSHLVLNTKSTVPGDLPIIAIEYKYNIQEVIYFITSEDTDITKYGFPYLSKYDESFYNVTICPVDHYLEIPKFFGFINEFDSHNKPI